MKTNAKKLYKKYVQAVAQMDYDYIVDFFYGQGTMDLMEIKSLDEALDKALLIEKLKKIYSLASNYNINWNSGTNVLPATNEMIMNFFRWIDNDRFLSNDDLLVINNTIDLLTKNQLFSIKIISENKLSLMDIITSILSKRIKIDYYRNELKVL